MPSAPTMTRPLAPDRPRNLAEQLVARLGDSLREGRWAPGERLPTESGLAQEHGVSRTVVREALSRLQAAGLVQTRHGVGTFACEPPPSTAALLQLHSPEQAATLRDVVAVLELRLALESEAAALAAVRRSEAALQAMRAAQRDMALAIAADGDAATPDRRLHQEIAAATDNRHFVELMGHLADRLIPRVRIDTASLLGESRQSYLSRVHGEHENIVNAIANGDPEAARAAMRIHLGNSRNRLRLAQEAAAAVATTG